MNSLSPCPNRWVVRASGGTACVKDFDVTITMTGGSPGCYRLSMITNLKGTLSEDVNSNGVATISHGSGGYSEDTDVHFKIEKTCGTQVREDASYTVQFHL